MPQPKASPLPAWAVQVGRVIRAIPKGEVLSYSQVALRAGMPGNPRGVVRALKLLTDVPWWRVVRADRTLAVEMVEAQAPKLRREGVRVEGRRIVPPAAKKAPRHSKS